MSQFFDFEDLNKLGESRSQHLFKTWLLLVIFGLFINSVIQFWLEAFLGFRFQFFDWLNTSSVKNISFQDADGDC
jgi:hypothetical protein